MLDIKTRQRLIVQNLNQNFWTNNVKLEHNRQIEAYSSPLDTSKTCRYASVPARATLFWPETDVKIRNGAAFKYENYHALNVNEVKSSVKLGRDGLVATTRRWRSKIRWNACNHLVVAILKMTIGTSPRYSYCYSQVLQVVPILVPMTVLYCTSTGTVAPVLVLVPVLLQWYCGSATGCYREQS
jgi:hypothetical protein